MTYSAFKISDSFRLIYVPDLFKIYKLNVAFYSTLPNYFILKDSSPIQKAESFSKIIVNNENNPLPTACTLALTSACNLRCRYCYEGLEPKEDVMIMPLKMALRTINFIVSNAKKCNSNNFKVSYFGGEPTTQFDKILLIHKYANDIAIKNNLKYKSSIGTNGVVSISNCTWIADNIDTISISIDGIEKIQNCHRSNSFSKVLETADLLYLKVPNKIGFRMTVSNISLPYLIESISFLANRYPGCAIHPEPVTIKNNFDNIVKEPPIEDFLDKLSECNQIAIKYNCKFNSSISLVKSNRDSFCGISGKNFVISPNGRIFSCHRYMFGTNEESRYFVYGKFVNKFRKFIFSKSKLKYIHGLSAQSIPECRVCFAKGFCHGDCPAIKLEHMGESFNSIPSFRCVSIKEYVRKELIKIFNNSEL